MVTIPAKPKCKHCGSTDDIPLLHNGKHGTVCHPCRREKIKATRRHLFGVFDPPRAAPRPQAKQSYSDHKAKVQRAIDRAHRDAIPMMEALRIEGVIHR